MGEIAMSITASGLRKNIYTLLDDVLKTGKPLRITRKGANLDIVPSRKRDKLNRLVKHNCINGDPETIVHIDWSDELNIDLP